MKKLPYMFLLMAVAMLLIAGCRQTPQQVEVDTLADTLRMDTAIIGDIDSTQYGVAKVRLCIPLNSLLMVAIRCTTPSR